MKAIYIFCSLTLLMTPLSLLSQQIDLAGVVSIHNSKYLTGTIQYVQNAQVSAMNASPTATDNKGEFTLIFIGVDGGDKVNVQVEKKDWDIVNTHDLANVIVGRTSPLEIYLQKKDLLAQSQAEFYKISKEALYAEHDRRIAILEKEGMQAQALVDELNTEFNLEIRGKNEAIFELKKQLKIAEKRLPEFARDLAHVNLDFASELYVQAYELMKEGKVTEALEVLDNAKLEKSVEDVISTIKVSKELDQKANEKGIQTKKALELKAEGHYLLLEYRQALQSLEIRLELMEELNSVEDTELADAYRELAGVYRDLG
ncbi:MAG: hypothetical protein AAFY76_22490, partial [Cyanobacteria bacterium J06649_11]